MAGRHRIITTILVGMIGLTTACQFNSSSMSETVASRSAKKLRETAEPAPNVSRKENIVLLGKSSAIFFLNLAEDVPDAFSRDLRAYVNQRVAKTGFFNSIPTETELTSFFKKNRSLQQKKDLYLDSLAQVSVSNRDISFRLGKALNVDNLIAFQIDYWPCAECRSPLRIRLKMRLVDLTSGMIIWTGINELEFETAEEASYAELLTLSSEILDQFEMRFRRKWHRKRFQHLGRLARN